MAPSNTFSIVTAVILTLVFASRAQAEDMVVPDDPDHKLNKYLKYLYPWLIVSAGATATIIIGILVFCVVKRCVAKRRTKKPQDDVEMQPQQTNSSRTLVGNTQTGNGRTS